MLNACDVCVLVVESLFFEKILSLFSLQFPLPFFPSFFPIGKYLVNTY